jgi:hypothetical protein
MPSSAPTTVCSQAPVLTKAFVQCGADLLEFDVSPVRRALERGEMVENEYGSREVPRKLAPELYTCTLNASVFPNAGAACAAEYTGTLVATFDIPPGTSPCTDTLTVSGDDFHVYVTGVESCAIVT